LRIVVELKLAAISSVPDRSSAFPQTGVVFPTLSHPVRKIWGLPSNLIRVNKIAVMEGSLYDGNAGITKIVLQGIDGRH